MFNSNISGIVLGGIPSPTGRVDNPACTNVVSPFDTGQSAFSPSTISLNGIVSGGRRSTSPLSPVLLAGAAMFLEGCKTPSSGTMTWIALGSAAVYQVVAFLSVGSIPSLGNLFHLAKDRLNGPRYGTIEWVGEVLKRMGSESFTTAMFATRQLERSLENLSVDVRKTLVRQLIDRTNQIPSYYLSSYLAERGIAVLKNLVSSLGSSNQVEMILQLFDGEQGEVGFSTLNCLTQPGSLLPEAVSQLFSEMEGRISKTPERSLAFMTWLLEDRADYMKRILDSRVAIIKAWMDHFIVDGIGMESPDLFIMWKMEEALAWSLWDCLQNPKLEARRSEILKIIISLRPGITFLTLILRGTHVQDIPVDLLKKMIRGTSPGDLNAKLSPEIKERPDVVRLLMYVDSGLPFDPRFWNPFLASDRPKEFLDMIVATAELVKSREGSHHDLRQRDLVYAAFP